MAQEDSTPRRYELGEKSRLPDLQPAGTTVVRPATAYGTRDRFRTLSPCCNSPSLVSAIDSAWTQGTGSHITCLGCKWKWEVFLCLGTQRLERVPERTAHPHIGADRAEWVSRGFGTRPYRRKRP